MSKEEFINFIKELGFLPLHNRFYIATGVMHGNIDIQLYESYGDIIVYVSYNDVNTNYIKYEDSLLMINLNQFQGINKITFIEKISSKFNKVPMNISRILTTLKRDNKINELFND